MKSKELKEVLASRTGLFKSYIKNIKVEAVRSFGHVSGWSEYDYSFTYKGKRYICEEHFTGNKMYSAKREYILKEVQ